ncbi:hypothetical protein K438DRAFT_2100529 [Mycena galopus ATCC 62051]|nr:hypothetical protein K438DRAFT_2100529 [Mycena galopus ATCC 62051]
MFALEETPKAIEHADSNVERPAAARAEEIALDGGFKGTGLENECQNRREQTEPNLERRSSEVPQNSRARELKQEVMFQRRFNSKNETQSNSCSWGLEVADKDLVRRARSVTTKEGAGGSPTSADRPEDTVVPWRMKNRRHPRGPMTGPPRPISIIAAAAPPSIRRADLLPARPIRAGSLSVKSTLLAHPQAPKPDPSALVVRAATKVKRTRIPHACAHPTRTPSSFWCGAEIGVARALHLPPLFLASPTSASDHRAAPPAVFDLEATPADARAPPRRAARTARNAVDILLAADEAETSAESTSRGNTGFSFERKTEGHTHLYLLSLVNIDCSASSSRLSASCSTGSLCSSLDEIWFIPLGATATPEHQARLNVAHEVVFNAGRERALLLGVVLDATAQGSALLERDQIEEE